MSHWLPVDNPKHTEVLGYRVSSRGRGLWDDLDWGSWWLDYSCEWNLFSHARCMYFHVSVKADSEADGAVYRVRCWYAGGKYRGREVLSVGLGFKDGKLHWIVRTKPASV